MNSYDSVRAKYINRKMCQILGNNSTASTMNGGSQNVAVTGIGQMQFVHNAFIASDQSLARFRIHLQTSAF